MKPKKNLNKLSLNKSTVSRLDNLVQARIRAGVDVQPIDADIIAWFRTNECSEKGLCETVFKHYCVTVNSLSCFAYCATTLLCDGLGQVEPGDVIPLG